MNTYSTFFIYKMQGTGNDFLIVNLCDLSLTKYFPKQQRPQIVQKLCNRKFGIGADGLLFVEPHAELDFQWDFYNSDGSMAEMCGNAARCVTRFAIDAAIAQSPLKFQTLAGTINASIENNLITVETTPIVDSKPLSVNWSESVVDFSLLDSGVPHAVIVSKTEDLQTPDNFKLAQFIRSDTSVGPRGANVTFYSELSSGKIKSVSFERGVEGFTLACGTGVLAAGYDYCAKNGLKTCDVTVPGGQLKVDFQGKSPKLIGPAKFIGRVEISEELLKG